MNERGKSDGSVVPQKRVNNGGQPSAESVEGRDPAKENASQQSGDRTQGRVTPETALERVRQAARADKEKRFTALWHHVYDLGQLRRAYSALSPRSTAGVDGVTWEAYGYGLEDNLQELSGRLARGAYRPKPVRRAYIPKADGKQRPIGVPALEDKIVQRATVAVLNAIYEEDFVGFSYGFRPRRSQHNALDALVVGINTKKVNWVLDADIRGFFDAIDHEWMMKFIEHRIADRRVQRHIKKWLRAGVLEDGEVRVVEEGTPQGGSISPLLANLYLHYVFDLWAHQWRQKRARGEMILVRYADDFIVGFEYRDDAERFVGELKQRLQKFKLELHPEKTRLLEFGRYAEERRQGRGDGKPETFNFLGFTFICARTRSGKFQLRRRTEGKRVSRKLADLKVKLRKRLHDDPHEVGKWLRSVLRGHFQYYGVPLNYQALQKFRNAVEWQWYRTLRRRSQRTTLTWERMRERYTTRWLPTPALYHPWPNQRLRVTI